jgi:hypothetical protein
MNQAIAPHRRPHQAIGSLVPNIKTNFLVPTQHTLVPTNSLCSSWVKHNTHQLWKQPLISASMDDDKIIEHGQKQSLFFQLLDLFHRRSQSFD